MKSSPDANDERPRIIDGPGICMPTTMYLDEFGALVNDAFGECHSEWEGGYSEPLDELGPDGTEYGVCCGAARYVTTNGAKSHD